MVAQKESPIYSILRSSLAQNGALIDGVAVYEEDDDRCLVATRDLAPGHVILRLKFSQLISDKRARECPVVGTIMDTVKTASLSDRLPDVDGPDAAITLYILREMARGDQSPLAPWLSTLPAAFHTPLTAEEDDVHEFLSGTPVMYLSLRLRDELREMYDQWFVPFAMNTYPDEYPAHLCTFDRFMRVHSIYDSRAFHVEDQVILAPFADFANHRALGSPEVNVRVRGWRIEGPDSAPSSQIGSIPGNDSGIEMFISAPETVRSSTELSISYGSFSNAQLLTHYGFSLHNNAFDSLSVTLTIPEEDSIHVQTKKLILLNLDSCGLLSLNHDLTPEKPLPSSLVASMRLLVMDEEELAPITIRNAKFESRISHENEMSMKSQLVQLFLSMLEEYPPVKNGRDKERKSTFEHFCSVYVQATSSIIKRAIDALNALE